MTVDHLDKKLDKLQAQSVNNGGIFRFRPLAIPADRNLENFLLSLSKEVKAASIQNEQAKVLIGQRIDHWSLYEGPTPERKENTKEYEGLRREFVNDLFDFLDLEELIEVFQVENLDIGSMKYSNKVRTI